MGNVRVRTQPGFIGFAPRAHALFHQMKDLNLKALGLQMNPEDLFLLYAKSNLHPLQFYGSMPGLSTKAIDNLNNSLYIT